MDNNKLVVYFSASNTTKSAAQKIAKAANCELFEIHPETPYTHADLDGWDENSRATKEAKDRTTRPKIENKIENVLFSFKCENLKYQKLKEYPSCNYKKYLEKIKDFEERLNKIYHTPLNKNVNINLWEYFYFNLFKKTKSGNIYFYKLSKGEQQQYITILNLYYKSVQANSLAQTLIFEDDIDANLHPEWSRMFIYIYKGIKKFFKKQK